MRLALPFVVMAGAFTLPAGAAPPPGPPPDLPLVQGPGFYCFGSAMQIRLSEGDAIKRYPMAEPWQPMNFIWRKPDGWIAVSVDHERVSLPQRSARLGLVRKVPHGKLFSYRTEPDETYNLVFFPRKPKAPVVTMAFLGASDAESATVKYGHRTTTQLAHSDVERVLSAITFGDRCPSNESSEKS